MNNYFMARLMSALAPLFHSRNWAGDCYEVAAKAAQLLDKNEDGVPVWLCHGEPLGRGPIAHVGRFGHAWVEVGYGHNNEERMVFDLTVRLSPLDDEAFYAAGQMTGPSVRRYTLTEARTFMLDTQHYGPWQGPLAATTKPVSTEEAR